MNIKSVSYQQNYDNNIIDEITIKKLLSLTNDHNLLVELYNIYKNEAENNLLQLKQAVANNDMLTLKRLGHTLKSASANIGALKLADICKELETSSAVNVNDDIIILSESIEKNYHLACQVLEKNFLQ